MQSRILTAVIDGGPSHIFRHFRILPWFLPLILSSGALSQEALPDIEVGAAKPSPVRTQPQSAAPPAQVSGPELAPVDTAQQFDADQEAASEHFTTGKEINAVPFNRPAEALETAVPGLVVTTHSGEGKANQYQLRGFQLDHGTDLALWLDGMPLNMRTHGHAQGYADANFLIPELLSYVIARKGPYYAEEGDFASAGSVHMQYIDKLKQGLVVATGGSFGYGRLLGIQSYKVAGGDLLAALELGNVEGPWTRPDEMHKINGVSRWSQGTQDNGLSLTGMAYANRWFSTDQIPQRAVTEGIIPLWGDIDPTDGGNTTRLSFSGRWSQTEGDRASRVEVYAIHSTLNLFNNFDYFLTQPDLGDQFRQFDRRTVLGVNARHGVKYDLTGFPVETDFGFQGRYDDIRVGLQDTWRRQPYDTVTNDGVAESSIAFWTDTTVRWNSWLRTTGGFRFDYYHASIGDIQDPLSAPKDATDVPIWTGPWSSGTKSNAITSPKAAIVLGPWEKTELFLNFGEGFHSTDARGTVTTQSPTDGSQVATIPLLVKSHGAEIGARTKAIEGLDSTISFWWLNFDSENQFDGDTGATIFGRTSRRYGVELNNHYSPTDWVHFDGDLALTHSRFRGVDQVQALTWIGLIQPGTVGYYTYLGNAAGDYIPEGPSIVASVGLEVGEKTGWFGALKYRYRRVNPLTEDGYFKAPAVGTLNLRVGYRFDNGWKLQADAFNVTNSRSDQITYAYGSLLKTDPLFAPCQTGLAPAAVCAIGQMDRHFHPVEAPAVRVTVTGPLPF
jgi:outer membrane receptor protein involved in Fe transport